MRNNFANFNTGCHGPVPPRLRRVATPARFEDSCKDADDLCMEVHGLGPSRSTEPVEATAREHGLSTSPEVSSASIIALSSAHPDARAYFEDSADAERRANGEGGCSLDDDSPAADVSLTSPEPFPTRTRLD